MKTYKPVPFKTLKNETITATKYGNSIMDNIKGYGCVTIETESGREFVIWNSYGEQCLNEIVEG